MRTARLLIVEDDPLTRKTIVSVAREAGFSVAGEASSGPDAVTRACELQPDAILMDIEMPGFDGLEAARRIQLTRPTPIIVLTAHDSDDLLRTGARTGVGAYLLKPPVAADLICAVAIARARHADLIELRNVVEQKNILVHEVYHRVSNQMNVAANLLHMQALRVPHPLAHTMLLESESRIRAMARVHQVLQCDPHQTQINLGHYLSALALDLISGLRPDLQFQDAIQGEPLTAPSSVAITCGLILHELVMNCIRHAFPGGQWGIVQMKLTHGLHEPCRLSVRDNGKGLPPSFSLEQPTSLGLMIANALTRDLNGTLSATASHPGTEFTLTFPKPSDPKATP